MFAEERRLRIRQIVSGQKTVSASELCEILRVTPATIRRDLAALEHEGVLVRSHGGAVSRDTSTSFQLSYDILQKTERKAKESIAREAANLILDGDTVFLEGSTTVFEVARLLHGRAHLTILTNSPSIVCLFQESPGITVMCTGGELKKETQYLWGVWAHQALEHVRLDKAVLGVSAIDPDHGMSSASHAEAEIKKILCRAAKKRIAVADHTKFGKQRFAYVGPVTDIDILVTDEQTDPRQIERIREAGVQVLISTAPSAAGSNGKN